MTRLGGVVGLVGALLALGAAPGQVAVRKSDRGDVAKDLAVVELGTRQAIVIGLDDYEHEKLTHLQVAHRDAEDVAALLERAGWSVRKMTMSVSGARPTTAATVLKHVREVYESTTIQDTVLVYFAGHGIGATLDGRREDYLLLHTTDPDRLAETALPLSALQRLLEVEVPVATKTHAAKTILMIDACRDSTRSLSKGFTLDQLRVSRGHGVLFATEREATAKEIKGVVDLRGRPIENGLFTHFLLHGLRGEANENGDGYVTFRELSFWLGEQMSLFGDKYPSARQTPFFTWDGGASYDIALVKVEFERPPEPDEGRRLAGLRWLRKNAQGYDEYALVKDETVELILVPGGTFRMGSTDGDSDEKPVTEVTLSAYLIGKHEVTWAQYGRFLEATGHRQPTRPRWGEENHPVVNVRWAEAKAYCDWAGLRLPTEAEWEHTARGREGLVYPWGSTVPTAATKRCNMRGSEDGYEFTAPVGSFPLGVGPFGTLDQAGNVWEWVADWPGMYPGGSVTNPTGPIAASSRGGSWRSNASYLRGAYRYWLVPDIRIDNLGFRPASQVTP